MPGCTICGGRFAEHTCAFCGRQACSSCLDVEVRKCIKCNNRTTVPLARFVRQNMILVVFLGLIWIFVVYPFPFLSSLGYEIDISVMQPVLIATLVIVIPFIFMFKAWQKRPPR